MENSDSPLPCSSLAASSWAHMLFITAYHPGDDTELSLEKIHKRVKNYLSRAEKKEFQNMTPNKIAVVSHFHEVLTDYLPGIDSTTYRLFGYSKLHELDHIALTGLYQGLINNLGCKVDEFLEAYESGQLASLIESKFSKLREGSRGGYYGWFLERRVLFNSLKPSSGVLHMGSAENEAKAQKCRKCKAFATTYCGGCKRVWYCSNEHLKEDLDDHKGTCNQDSKPSSRQGGNCVVCNTFASTCCGRCRKVWYCSKEHQRFDWKDHKQICGHDV